MSSLPYDPSQAVFWSDFVDLAYKTFNASDTNPEPPAFPAGWEFQGNLQVDLTVVDTTYFIGWIASKNSAEWAVVFLGTEDLEWLYDSDFLHASHPIGGKVEAGMYDMYKSLKIATPGQPGTTPFSSYLAANLKSTMPVHIAGHSLGGALTTFTAAEIAGSSQPPASDLLSVYSLASPRVGDKDFAAAFNRLVPNNYRIYNVQDYVPTLPPEDVGYTHVAAAEPIPELNSWDYPVYHGWDPITAAECYHSYMVYNYMLKVRDGQNPDPSQMGSCYVKTQHSEKVQLSRAKVYRRDPPAARQS